MMDRAVDKILAAIFSLPSVGIHTVWFVWEYATHQDINLFTNLISIEAIYIGLFVGIQQLRHHETIKTHITKGKKK